MAKLTLNIDDAVLAGAKRHAKEHGVSLSRMVAAYLAGIIASPTPVLDSLRGVLKKANVEDLRQHLITKYL